MTNSTIAQKRRVRNDLTAEFVRSILDYDPETGVFRWKERPEYPQKWNTRYAGTVAGAVSSNHRYVRLQIRIEEMMYKAHRIAWLYFYGEWPANDIDHIDGNAINNKISNLRCCTKVQNSANSKGKSRCGLPKGVDYSMARKKYRARISMSGSDHHLGYFDDPQSAHLAYCDASKRIHGEFSRTK